MALFNYRQFNDCMAEGESPPVYVVDTQASRPPLPPRLNHEPKQSSRTQILLYLLVSLAFFGLFVEACFIFFLHQQDAVRSAQMSCAAVHSPASAVYNKQTADENGTTKDNLPSKPVAHMTGGKADDHDPHIMAWNTEADPLLNEIGYKDKSLIIERAGYYYVYSKVFFSESKKFYHHVQKRTQRYADPITLLQSRKYSSSSDIAKSNSFLGGVFYFEINDAVFVNVSDTKQIVTHTAEENVFGAYMI